MTITDIEHSNSLADLAARIKVEHEAATSALKDGMRHALACGRLLIEAKEQLKHGKWLPWLNTKCDVSVRTAQAYMRVARAFGALGDDADGANTQRVADLSFRGALDLIADDAWPRAIKKEQKLRVAAKFTLDTPQALLPLVTGQRKKRVAWHKEKRRYMLAIGPEISRADMIERQKAAREAPSVRELQQEHGDLIAQAEALEAEAKAIRDDAASTKQAIGHDIRTLVGSLKAYSETYDFQCDEVTFAELQKLTEQQAAERLLNAAGDDDGLRQIKRGSWGDYNVGIGLDFCRPYPRRELGSDGDKQSGWTLSGSSEWLAELFPDWDEQAITARAPAGEPGRECTQAEMIAEIGGAR
jgi:hypothetical protein